MKDKHKDRMDDLKIKILEVFAQKPYDDNMISEEEFIFDGLHNETLYQVLTSSLRTFNIGGVEVEESSEDEENVREILKNQ